MNFLIIAVILCIYTHLLQIIDKVVAHFNISSVLLHIHQFLLQQLYKRSIHFKFFIFIVTKMYFGIVVTQTQKKTKLYQMLVFPKQISIS